MRRDVGSGRYVVGGTTLDLSAACVVRSNGEREALGEHEHRLLRALVARGGEVLSRDELARVIANGSILKPQTITTIVHRLRLKLGEAGALLVTMLGRGYRFVEPPSGNTPSRMGVHQEIVGRDAELDRLAHAPTLLWLVGPGGSGKTTLLRAHASRAAAWMASVIWIDLGAPSPEDPEMHVPWLALALGLGVDSHVNEPSEALAARLARALERRRRTLLIIDPAERCRAVLEHWLEGLQVAAGTQIIIASRAPPERGRVLALSPLAPDAAQALFELRLYQARLGRALRSEEAALARTLTSKLGGLPLAIELAACRAARDSIDTAARSLSPPHETLSSADGPWESVHRSLGRVMDESFAILEPMDRSGLLTLALVPRPVTTRELARLAPGGAPTAERLTAIGWLMPAPHHPERWTLLDPLRAYLRDRLANDPRRGELTQMLVELATSMVIPWLDPRRDYLPHDDWGPILAERELLLTAARLAATARERTILWIAIGVIALRQGPREALVEVLEAMPRQGVPDDDLVATAELQRAALADLLGRDHEMDEALARGVDAAERGRRGPRETRRRSTLLLVRLLTTQAHRHLQDSQRARELLERALVIARTQPEAEVVTFVVSRVAAQDYREERYPEALERLDDCLAAIGERTSLMTRLHVVANRMFTLAELGDADRTMAACDELDRMMAAAGHAFDTGFVDFHRALALVEQDRGAGRVALETARAHYLRAGRERDAAACELLTLVLDVLDDEARDPIGTLGALLPRLDVLNAAWAEALLGHFTKEPEHIRAALGRLGGRTAPCTRRAIELLHPDADTSIAPPPPGHRARISLRLRRRYTETP